jgi:hypothetical protein
VCCIRIEHTHTQMAWRLIDVCARCVYRDCRAQVVLLSLIFELR